MGLLTRLTTTIKAKLSNLLDRAEDPRETLDYSYEKQLELLQNVKRGMVEVVASKRRLQFEAEKMKTSIPKLEAQARQALQVGREDLARIALERKQVALAQVEGLDLQIADLEREQDKLTAASQRLSAKVEIFRTRKEVIKAQYSAAEAQVKIGEATSGISEEMADVGMSIDRAVSKTDQLRSRASAIDELTTSGVLEDATRSSDLVDRELAKLSAVQAVELEMAALKGELSAPQQPKQLESAR